MGKASSKSKNRYRTVFLSDIHLGFHGCRAKELHNFLESATADKIVLVGDIIDLWSLKSTWYWPHSHTKILKLLLKRAENGVKIVYIPGNHDDFFRTFIGSPIKTFSIEGSHLHTCANGRLLLCMHGDEFDSVIQKHLWLAKIGSWVYDWLLALSSNISKLRDVAGRPHWSFSKYLKERVKLAVNYVGNYEKKLVEEADRNLVDGIIAGHIHTAALTYVREDVLYGNCGDWCESLTAIVEHFDGRLELLEHKT